MILFFFFLFAPTAAAIVLVELSVWFVSRRRSRSKEKHIQDDNAEYERIRKLFADFEGNKGDD